jgi:uncharacterized protein YdeI (YjbR/CyaY-like superfamily)
MAAVKPRFFRTAADLRRWFEKNHDTADELWVGLYRISSGKPTVTWPEVVEQALCFGWIDGIRKGIDHESYMNRLTPRRPGSNWSLRNIDTVEDLKGRGLMTPAGLAPYEARQEKRPGVYSYEDRHRPLPRAYQRRLKANHRAWEFFSSQSPSYRRGATYWVMSAKKEETRLRRLQELVDSSARGEKPRALRPV